MSLHAPVPRTSGPLPTSNPPMRDVGGPVRVPHGLTHAQRSAPPDYIPPQVAASARHGDSGSEAVSVPGPGPLHGGRGGPAVPWEGDNSRRGPVPGAPPRRDPYAPPSLAPPPYIPLSASGADAGEGLHGAGGFSQQPPPAQTQTWPTLLDLQQHQGGMAEGLTGQLSSRGAMSAGQQQASQAQPPQQQQQQHPWGYSAESNPRGIQFQEPPPYDE
uniref:Uncharacterized protein n=1 Tax=Chromera velia CCMP2878 TaxID=1169474 RepID=A0A0G4HA83_9ALVE|eukprot:Cvel_25604.t1-p1 / transcript=Cvel_25604.t1 / gene=Cvel_25604 / organism=Chromera_velia_CCMP2878 / gene_product=hypothetical protein / transcript_product=hypothetical protein / location=Cvel_scaffold2922:21800-22444(-) / protein_length=215 / sequence_SO=supercontig / SO=protein_coding / is_pseudo=false